MKNSVRGGLWILALVLTQFLVLGSADSAMAQRGGGGGRGMRGFLTVDKFRIAQNEKVQEALEVSDEIKGKLKELSDEAREKMNAAREENQGNLEDMGKAMEEINSGTAAKVAELLDEKQAKRLGEIYLQVNGAISLLDKEVAKSLGLKEEQSKELEETLTSAQASLREMFADFQEMEPEERQAKMAEWTKERDEKMLGVLTEEQTKAFTEAKGEKFEFDPADFRMGRGGQGGGGRGGRGQGGGRGGRGGQGGGRGGNGADF